VFAASEATVNDPTLFDVIDDWVAPVIPIAHARHTDPDTSHQAAATVTRITDSRQAILDAYRLRGPMADFDLEDYYAQVWQMHRWPRQSASGIRTRRAELADLGLVADTNRRTVTPSGRPCIIWGLR